MLLVSFDYFCILNKNIQSTSFIMISHFKLHITSFYFLSFMKPKSILKVSFILLILGICTSSSIHAQLIYSTNNQFSADVSVYVTDNQFSADLIVFKCDSQFSATKNKGLWYFTDNQFSADKVIYFTDNKFSADLIIYFTENQFSAAWKDNSKIHLMY